MPIIPTTWSSLCTVTYHLGKGLCGRGKSEIQQNNKVVCKTKKSHGSVNLLALIMALQVMTIMALIERGKIHPRAFSFPEVLTCWGFVIDVSSREKQLNFKLRKVRTDNYHKSKTSLSLS